IIVVGTSTGGALAAWLASHDNSERIAALVLLSPNFGPKRRDSELLLLPWGNAILQWVQGATYRFEPYNDLQQQYWTTQFPSEALLPMMGLVKLTRDKDFSRLRLPLLVMYSPADQMVDANAIREKFTQFASGTKKIIALTDSGDPQQHILAGDILSPHTTPVVANNIVDFLRQLPVPAPALRTEP
ncbi:MAG TPA: alpha/beta hydrolase, partial [Gammaproteobacteria bacterium]